jgi:hypothetical protein
MTTKRKIGQDNPAALLALGGALVSGALEAGTAIAQKATGPGSPMSVDDADGDGVALFVGWAEQNLEPGEMRSLGEALLSAADDADKGAVSDRRPRWTRLGDESPMRLNVGSRGRGVFAKGGDTTQTIPAI